MEKVKNFFELRVWKEATDLLIEIYHLSDTFPKTEQYGITNQLRRAVASIGANIAEGFGRYYSNDKIKFYRYARGSTTEVQNFLFVCNRLHYISEEDTSRLFEKNNHYYYAHKRINPFSGSVSHPT